MKRGMQVGLGLCHIVLDGDTASQKNFSAHVYLGQIAGRMPLGMGVGLSTGDTVLDGDPAPPKKGHSTPTFWTMSIVAKRLDASSCHLV